MAQLRADIHQTENEKKRKRDSKINIAPPIFESDEQEIINVESQEYIERTFEDSQDGYITTEQDWEERLEEWEELLKEEERAQQELVTEEFLDYIELNNDLLSLYTHPAINIDAKWDLRDVFIRELERPAFISISSEFS